MNGGIIFIGKKMKNFYFMTVCDEKKMTLVSPLALVSPMFIYYKIFPKNSSNYIFAFLNVAEASDWLLSRFNQSEVSKIQKSPQKDDLTIF